MTITFELGPFGAEVNCRLQTSGGLDSPEEVRSALAFLHEIGHLLYFTNLTRAVVLDPIWLCDLLVRLLISPNTTPTRAGTLSLRLHNCSMLFELFLGTL